jgi:hypothetical protein
MLQGMVRVTVRAEVLRILADVIIAGISECSTEMPKGAAYAVNAR